MRTASCQPSILNALAPMSLLAKQSRVPSKCVLAVWTVVTGPQEMEARVGGAEVGIVGRMRLVTVQSWGVGTWRLHRRCECVRVCTCVPVDTYLCALSTCKCAPVCPGLLDTVCRRPCVSRLPPVQPSLVEALTPPCILRGIPAIPGTGFGQLWENGSFWKGCRTFPFMVASGGCCSRLVSTRRYILAACGAVTKHARGWADHRSCRGGGRAPGRLRAL